MLLALDTTTEILHLALVSGARTWSRRLAAGVGRSHSERLLPAIEDLLAEAGA
jgi:tRNA A37 threonylcarbamoyladenosine modification protein TsaB